MTNNTSERDKEIDEAADKWEHETYDDYKDCYSFKEGARWADSHPAPSGKVLDRQQRIGFCPHYTLHGDSEHLEKCLGTKQLEQAPSAPTGKVLSDEERERLQFCRDEWAKNALHSTHLRRNYFWLIETLERLAEQKPAGER